MSVTTVSQQHYHLHAPSHEHDRGNNNEPLEEQQFCFPLPAGQKTTSQHSRQYTGVELPWSVTKDLRLDAPNLQPNLQSSPTSNANPSGSSSPPRSPARRHAHKRSGAVSQHDIQFKLESSPSLTLASSNSSVPIPPTSTPSASSSATSSPASRQTKVSFADNTVKDQDQPESNNNKPRPQSTCSTTSVMSAPPLGSDGGGKKRHKRVRSLANLFRKKPPQLHSSSYIPALNLIHVDDYSDDDEQPQPVINLDDGIVDPHTFARESKHRRSESAPERTSMKRKMESSSNESIIEEDESENNQEEGASSSQVSLQSQGSAVNRDRGRYSRNYNNGLLALGLSQLPATTTTTTTNTNKEDKENKEDKRASQYSTATTITRQSIAGTITDDKSSSKKGKRMSTFSLGEPGPEVHSVKKRSFWKRHSKQLVGWVQRKIT